MVKFYTTSMKRWNLWLVYTVQSHVDENNKDYEVDESEVSIIIAPEADAPIISYLSSFHDSLWSRSRWTTNGFARCAGETNPCGWAENRICLA